MNMKKSLFHFSGIRKKLILYYLVITLILGLTSVFSYYNAKLVLNRLKTIISDYVYLNDLNHDVDLLMTEVEKYLTTKSSNALLNYYTVYDTLAQKTDNISREASYDINELMMKDIGYLIDDLLLEADHAVKAKRGRISNEYNAHFTRSYEISEYVKRYINQLLNNKLQEGSNQYGAITKNMTLVSYTNVVIIGIAVAFNIALAIIFTYRLTKPIIELAHSAEKISQGDFSIKPLTIHTDDEISILAKAFDKMVVNIKSHIDDIKNQAEVENRLKEQEMENLKMKSLLRDAELKALQSQINPHFLFNTFNAAGQLAMMEGADRASEFIENIAQLFRYNLRRLDEPVSLRDEVNYVKNYMYILKTRFGDKIEFKIDIPRHLLGVKVPCTIIQPIVENAFIHGLENLERTGEIQVKAGEMDGRIFVTVRDNGIGMAPDKIESLMLAHEDQGVMKHASGIGIHNVVDRLRLFYNIEAVQDVIEIKSKPDQGTRVTLKLPYEGGSIK